MRRILDLPEDYDTEDEEACGPGGLVPNSHEEEDFGGEALKHKKVVDRAIRRLARDGQPSPLTNLTQTLQVRRRKARGYDDDAIGTVRERRVTTTSHGRQPNKRGKSIGKASLQPPLEESRSRSRGAQESQEDGLDDLDLDLLGESRDENEKGEGEEGDEESGIDDTEEGEGDDDTEEEVGGGEEV